MLQSKIEGNSTTEIIFRNGFSSTPYASLSWD